MIRDLYRPAEIDKTAEAEADGVRVARRLIKKAFARSEIRLIRSIW